MNVQAGQPQFNLEVLQGLELMLDLPNKFSIPPAYMPRLLLLPTEPRVPCLIQGENLTKVVQGPSEPYSDFVARLMALAGKIFGDVDTAMPVIKQLAIENANKYCQEAIRPHQSKPLNEYLKICKDIDGNHIQAHLLAAALQRATYSNFVYFNQS